MPTSSRKKSPNTGEKREKNPAAVALGKLGGLKGGPARAAKLSAKRRSSIARMGANKTNALIKQKKLAKQGEFPST